MENSMQTSLGVLIGGVHTYFPKEIIRGISKEAEKENKVNTGEKIADKERADKEKVTAEKKADKEKAETEAKAGKGENPAERDKVK